MDDSSQKLLMMFIKDSYKSATGKPSKKTAIALMKYVASDSHLQELINNGDNKAILDYKPMARSKDLKWWINIFYYE